MIAPAEAFVDGRRARLWTGGAGERLLLVHGGWGGAELHWSTVWDALAEKFCVVAPELPGIGDRSRPGFATLDAYVDWLARLLEVVAPSSGEGAASKIFLVGNSLGAALAWQLAARLGERCGALVLVNGPPPREAPPPIRALAALAPRPLLRALYRKLSFSPPVLARAFADPARAPAELARLLHDPPTEQLDLLLKLIARGARPAPRSPAPLLFAWGANDPFPGTRAADARALHKKFAGSELRLFAPAGHCPQLEQPDAFVEALLKFFFARQRSGVGEAVIFSSARVAATRSS